MAGGMAIGIVGTLLADEPRVTQAPPRTIVEAIVEPFRELVARLRWRSTALVLAFAALYRFGDYFVQAVVIDFLHRDAAFSLTTIGVVTKGVGFLGTLVGGLAAGGLVARFGLRKMLVAFGVLAAITNLLYMWLAFVGHDLTVFTIAIGVDYASTALGVSAFLSVLMGVCSPAFSATQFALLTSLASVGQRVFGPFAADVVHAAGWTGFFASTALMALPGLALAWLVTRDVKTAA
jgi:PAT family beta-lactamase induction signal transducer AmpG